MKTDLFIFVITLLLLTLKIFISIFFIHKNKINYKFISFQEESIYLFNLVLKKYKTDKKHVKIINIV